MWHVPVPETTAATRTVDTKANASTDMHTDMIMAMKLNMSTRTFITMTMPKLMPVMLNRTATMATVTCMTAITAIISMCGKETGKR